MLGQLIDLLPWPGLPSRGKSAERGAEVVARILSNRLRVPDTARPEAIKQALNDSGWLEAEVVAAGELRQGKEPSFVSVLTGLALIELLRPRRAKSLSRHFVLAVTDDRVVAYKTLSVGDDMPSGVSELWIRPGELGSWPRESVRLIRDPRRGGATAATLELGGLERVPVFRANDDPSTDELVEVLAG